MLILNPQDPRPKFGPQDGQAPPFKGNEHGMPPYEYLRNYGEAQNHSAPAPRSFYEELHHTHQNRVYYRMPHPLSGTVLTLGVLGFFIPLLSFAAWIVGGKAKREVYRAQGTPDMPLYIGWLLGVLASVGQILFFAFMAFLLVFAVSVDTTTDSGTTEIDVVFEDEG